MVANYCSARHALLEKNFAASRSARRGNLIDSGKYGLVPFMKSMTMLALLFELIDDALGLRGRLAPSKLPSDFVCSLNCSYSSSMI